MQSVYCTISLSKEYELQNGHEFVLPQLFVENLLSIHQACVSECLRDLGSTGPATMGETGSSARSAITWEMQEMTKTQQKRAREQARGGDI